MLFRRFTLFTLAAMVLGMSLVQILQPSGNERAEFALEDRLKAWRAFEANQACKADAEVCELALKYANAV